MNIVSGSFIVKCSKCGTEESFDAEDADFVDSFGSERQMGTENGYVWKRNYECKGCKSDIEIHYEVVEYPIGAFNNDIVKIEGGEEVNRFEYDFSDSLN